MEAALAVDLRAICVFLFLAGSTTAVWRRPTADPLVFCITLTIFAGYFIISLNTASTCWRLLLSLVFSAAVLLSICTTAAMQHLLQHFLQHLAYFYAR